MVVVVVVAGVEWRGGIDDGSWIWSCWRCILLFVRGALKRGFV